MAVADGDRPGLCSACGAPLGSGQRYCLGCGERTGPRSERLQQLIRRVHEPPAASSAPSAEGPVSSASDAVGWLNDQDDRSRSMAQREPWLSGLAGLSLPSPRISALLVLAFAGFGVALGAIAGSPTVDSFAASARPRVKLLLPAAAAAPATAGERAAAVEPPPAPSEATPEAAPAEAQVASAPAPAQAAPVAKAPTQSSAGEGGSAPAPGAAAAKLPAIKHVFVVMLSDEPYAATFGPESAAPYLSRTLEQRGALLARYYAVAHEQLANGIALVSGQGPTAATTSNCPTYTDVAPGTIGPEQQVLGDGCVYPATVPTLPGQLEVKHLTWRAYVQGIDETGSTAPACAHPAIGQQDASSGPSPGAGAYATFRNPFVYFHALTDSPTCAADDVGLSALGADLSEAKRTPSLSYIVPDRCHDGSPGPCPGGGPGGLPAADGLLKQIVPKILSSPAYKQGGLLLITADEAPSSGEFADSSSCCGQPRFANLPPPQGLAAGLPAEGGGQVGALLLSPFVKPHTTSQEPYNHFSLLRTVEDLFGLKHLGYAAGSHVSSLEPSLFTAKPTG